MASELKSGVMRFEAEKLTEKHRVAQWTTRRSENEHVESAPDQRGITTAEYAVGTAAGAGLAGLLYQMLTGGFGERLLRTLFDHVLSLLGLG
jgi:Protein of unknown function (DUF4244)